MLRAKDANAKANAKAKLKYEKIIGTDTQKHKFIIKCLIMNLSYASRPILLATCNSYRPG